PVLGREQPQNGGAVAGQLRVAVQVLLDPGGLVRLQAELELGVHKFDEQRLPHLVAGRQVVFNRRTEAPPPGLLEALDDAVQGRPILGGLRMDVLISGGGHRWEPRLEYLARSRWGGSSFFDGSVRYPKDSACGEWGCEETTIPRATSRSHAWDRSGK